VPRLEAQCFFVFVTPYSRRPDEVNNDYAMANMGLLFDWRALGTIARDETPEIASVHKFYSYLNACRSKLHLVSVENDTTLSVGETHTKGDR
jgi:hypothetical protein